MLSRYAWSVSLSASALVQSCWTELTRCCSAIPCQPGMWESLFATHLLVHSGATGFPCRVSGRCTIGITHLIRRSFSTTSVAEGSEVAVCHVSTSLCTHRTAYPCDLVVKRATRVRCARGPKRRHASGAAADGQGPRRRCSLVSTFIHFRLASTKLHDVHTI